MFRKSFLFLIKLAIILGIFVFLFRDAYRNDAFGVLSEQPKRWHLILAAFFLQCFAVSVTMLRWRLLARSLHLTVSLREAFRFGFLGLMLNLAPMGIVGGDAVKAYLLAKRNPGARTMAVASVIVDRIVGLLVMFLIGTILITVTGFAFREEIWAKSISRIVYILTATGFSGVGIVLLPFFAKGHVERLLAKIPLCGPVLSRLTKSLLLYRHQKSALLSAFLMTFLVHLPFGVALYLVARGLFSAVPGLLDHIMLYSVVNLTAMIPIAAGPFEFVLDKLYPLFQVDGVPMGIGIGLVVALGHRVVSILVAAIGVLYYLSSRNEIQEIVAEGGNERALGK